MNKGKQDNAISLRMGILMPKSICVQNVNPDKASLEDVLK